MLYRIISYQSWSCCLHIIEKLKGRELQGHESHRSREHICCREALRESGMFISPLYSPHIPPGLTYSLSPPLIAPILELATRKPEGWACSASRFLQEGCLRRL